MVKIHFSEPVTYQHKYIYVFFFYLVTNSTLAFSAGSDSKFHSQANPLLFVTVIQNSGGASADIRLMNNCVCYEQMETLFFL